MKKYLVQIDLPAGSRLRVSDNSLAFIIRGRVAHALANVTARGCPVPIVDVLLEEATGHFTECQCEICTTHEAAGVGIERGQS